MKDKKFEVKVTYFSEDKYKVQFAHYRIIRIWHTLCFWFESGAPSSFDGWSTSLFSIDEAEKLAKSINSINDIENYYKKEREKEKGYSKRRNEFYKKQKSPKLGSCFYKLIRICPPSNPIFPLNLSPPFNAFKSSSLLSLFMKLFTPYW